MMRLDFDLKTVVSFLISVLLVGVQALTGVYSNGITGLEWLGLAAVLFGPAGVVAAVNNTPWDPAFKAVVQNVCAVVVVGVQGIVGVYDGGVTGEEWLGVGLVLLSALAVYYAPAKSVLRR